MFESPSRPHAAEVLPATLTFTTALDRSQPRIVPGFLSRAGLVVGDILVAAAVVLCIPFVILAVGIPIALAVRLLLWSVGLL